MSVYRAAGVEISTDVRVPMRDGVELSADIYRPPRSGPLPVVLSRTPYDNTGLQQTGEFYAQQGYVFVAQDVRGRYDSDGTYYAWVNESRDGHDTLEWIGSQTWCDGNVGMAGSSYVAMVQWLAATEGSRYLKTIVPRVMGTNLHESPHYAGGAFQLGVNATWSFQTSSRTMQRADHYNWDELLRHLPLEDIDRAAGRDIPHLRDWIAHPSYDDYWKAICVQERYADIRIPVMQIGGWYDLYSGAMMESFRGMREQGGTAPARENQKIVMGPWIHAAGTASAAGDVDFGLDSMGNLRDIELRWFDRWLKGIENGIDEEAALRIFVMGANVWRDEHEWPLSRTAFTPYYLHSRGAANSLRGDGALSTEKPDSEPCDRFTYDPLNPVPTTGGCNCCNHEIVPWGAQDQRLTEAREDVLVYTSDPLEQDVEVTGPVRVKLHVSSDARDTDFTAKLVDLHPGGYAVNLCDGIRRARYRNSMESPELLIPGEVYELYIDLWVTSNVFLSGHCIRVEVSSSNFPRFDRNLNTGDAAGSDTAATVARQQVYHDSEHPSHIVLPIVP